MTEEEKKSIEILKDNERRMASAIKCLGTNFKITAQAKTYKEPEYKSKLHIGNTIVYNTKHFNWLNKKMFKIFFNVNIEDIKEN